MPLIKVTSCKDLNALVTLLLAAATTTVHRLKKNLQTEANSLQILRLIMLSGEGHHPTEDRALYIIEQLNQTCTHLEAQKQLGVSWNTTPKPKACG